MKEDHLRSVLKGASWRILGTLDTMVLSLIYTGQVGKALKIGAVELFTKIFLFYLHERIWMRMKFGTEEVFENGVLVTRDKHYRSLIKGASWRAIGSLDTFWIAIFVNSDGAHPTETAFYIAATEVITKIALFWFHERLWMKIKWGAKPLSLIV
jgi:uncharacterized membrane protein